MYEKGDISTVQCHCFMSMVVDIPGYIHLAIKIGLVQGTIQNTLFPSVYFTKKTKQRQKKIIVHQQILCL